MAKLSNSLAFVLLASVIAVSAWEPPKLPAGRRLQYYIQHPQGDYVYGYDTGEGSSHAAQSDTLNRVKGQFQYGSQSSPGAFAYAYSAGYVPSVNAAFEPTGFGTKSGSTPAVTSYDSGPSDASYSFSYDAGDHSRQEISDAAGNIVGSFAFTAKDGINRKVNYEAGAEKGFVAQGAHLPEAPPSPVGVKAVSAYIPAPLAPVPAAPIFYSAPPANSDGSYSFSYDAGDHSRAESSDASGNVRGHFAFVANDGVQRKVDYEAGAEKGFTAKGAHLPVAPPVPVIPFHPTFKYEAPKPVLPQVEAKVDSSANQDGSYSFSYDAGDHSRQESADAAGNVRGQFSFVAKDGVNRKVDYEANRDTGFLAKGAHLPVALDHPAQVRITNLDSTKSVAYTSVSNEAPVDGSYSFSYDAGDHSREESADSSGNVKGRFSFVAKDGALRKVNYEAGAEKGFVATGEHLPSAPEAAAVKTTTFAQSTFPTVPVPAPVISPIPATKQQDYSSGPSPDRAYSFSYVADDHSREESADAFGNVRGRFAFKATDGVNRKVEYEAGAEKGFVAKGDHIPSVGETPAQPAAPAYTPTSYTQATKTAQNVATISSDSSPVDGSYSFSYNAGDHAREESADAAGNVRGRFSFVAKDGVNRKIEYEAGAEKGFVAKGDHIPQTDSLELKKIAISPATTISHSAPAFVQTSAKSATTYSTAPGDGSYSFAYKADDHSREESADAAGNVRGQFSFVAKDGINRKVEYTAGAEKGFEAKGLHLPAETPVEAKTSIFIPSPYQAPKPIVPLTSPTTFKTSPVDASYSFAYEAEDHSRQESADAAGNVKGHFAFKAKDGVNRKVDYEAGAERGFIARGDHIPSDANFNLKSSIESSATVPIIPSAYPVQANSFPSSYASSGPADASYSFSYNADDHSREESSDAAGNVNGKFSFVAKDGVHRSVNYEAGAEKGFLAKGSHLPAPALVGGSDGQGYHYSYETDSSKKTESADANGYVTGSYSYLGSDGLTRKVDYRAGGAEGFVASGDHLQPSPVALKISPVSSYKPIIPSSSSSGSISSYSSSSASSKSKTLSSEPYSVRIYLPHESPSKFGYIYDSLV
ncbi:uncharacterized protein LOC124161145 [Ischnura elegans]|uniref:uncharacterized protein LOC124161145 n=1 Tax=Ischnura elegans TaxID=197161 RepID=UPI001ED86F0F|nr:uncharacterized protein LOC124161145 [Ischnura elegans]